MAVHATKIEYRPAGSGPYAVLADETVAVLGARISAFAPKMRSNPDIVPGAWAEGVTVFDRGNRQWDLSFTVDREHADEGAQAEFISDHAAAMNDVGNFDLKITTGDGVNYMPNCAITGFDPNPANDKSSVIRYAFTGGNYTTEEP